MRRKGNTFSLLVGMQTEKVTMEIVMEFPQRPDKYIYSNFDLYHLQTCTLRTLHLTTWKLPHLCSLMFYS